MPATGGDLREELLPLLLHASDACSCSCGCMSRPTDTTCSVLLLLKVSVMFAAVLMLQALRQASTAVSKRCCKQALLLLQARAPLPPRSSSPLRPHCGQRGQRRRRRAIFSLWRRCLHSECRGAQDKPHFCPLVLGAANCFCSLLLQVGTVACTTSVLHVWSCKCCRCFECFSFQRKNPIFIFLSSPTMRMREGLRL